MGDASQRTVLGGERDRGCGGPRVGDVTVAVGRMQPKPILLVTRSGERKELTTSPRASSIDPMSAMCGAGGGWRERNHAKGSISPRVSTS